MLQKKSVKTFFISLQVLPLSRFLDRYKLVQHKIIESNA